MNSQSNIHFALCFSNDLSTFDPYDIWKSSIGLKVKEIYYANKYFGFLPAFLLTLFDYYINNESRFFYKKQEYPIVRALAAQVLMNRYKIEGNPEFKIWAKKHIDWLLEHHSEGYSGICWGANMVWASKNGTYEKNTPFITNTPYVLEALIQYQEIEGSNLHNNEILSIYKFISKDLIRIQENDNLLCLSYAPVFEPRAVINANSYAMYALSRLLSFHSNKLDIFKKDILRIYNFLLLNQKNDGSWWYYADDLEGNFIDCFHTCFVLKNLIKTSKNVGLPDTFENLVENGYNFLIDNFFDEKNGLFRRFAKTDKTSIVKFDLYDNAEMLNLFYLKKETDKYDLLLLNIKKFFIEDSNIFSTIDLFGFKKNKNMLRWSVMPYLFAISNETNN